MVANQVGNQLMNQNSNQANYLPARQENQMYPRPPLAPTSFNICPSVQQQQVQQQQAQQQQQQQTNNKKKTTGPIHNSKYKAKMCKNWVKTGECPYHEKCQFAHGPAELGKWSSGHVQTPPQRSMSRRSSSSSVGSDMPQKKQPQPPKQQPPKQPPQFIYTTTQTNHRGSFVGGETIPLDQLLSSFNNIGFFYNGCSETSSLASSVTSTCTSNSTSTAVSCASTPITRTAPMRTLDVLNSAVSTLREVKDETTEQNDYEMDRTTRKSVESYSSMQDSNDSASSVSSNDRDRFLDFPLGSECVDQLFSMNTIFPNSF